MKKFLVLILSFLMASQSFVMADSSDESVSRVTSLGIVEGDENGLRLEDEISRAEFATIVSRMAGFSKPIYSESVFADVDADHWAKDYIMTAYKLRIINGVGDGKFLPEQNITYPEICKMLVCLLGYDDIAKQKGGWPNGYIAQAGSLGITKYADMSAEYAIRKEVISMIDSALDVKLAEQNYGRENGYYISENTLSSKLEGRLQAERFEGILEENAYMSALKETPDTEEGYVVISGRTIRSQNDYSDFVGSYVFGWIIENSNNKQEIVSVTADAIRTEITVVDAENARIDENNVIYDVDGFKEKKLRIADNAIYMYNGRRTFNPKPYLSNSGAKFRFVDNNGDAKADIVMIEQPESFVVERINASSSSVYFADNKFFRGRRGIKLLSDNEDKVMLYDSEGNTMEFDSIEAGDALTIYASEDMKLVRAYVSKEKITGTVDEISSDGKVTIGDVSYKTTEKIMLGESGEYIVDVNGVIVGTDEMKKENIRFGYIAAAKRESDMSSELKLLIIEPKTPEKEIVEKNGVETISYYLQNNRETTYVCKNKIKFSSDLTDGSYVGCDTAELDKDSLAGKIASFTIDKNGLIDSLRVYSVPDEFKSCVFNAEILSFGGENAVRGFCTDAETKIICIPNMVRTIGDYGVRTKITDEATYSVYGVTTVSDYSFDSEQYTKEPVDVLLIKAEMDSGKPYPIQEDSNICMVGSSRMTFDQNGDEIVMLEMLNGTEKITGTVHSDSIVFDTAKGLRMGDLIQFVKDSDGNIANIKKHASVQGLSKYSPSGNLYGVAYDVKYNTYDFMTNCMIDEIEITFMDSDLQNKHIKFFDDDEQKIYLYNRRVGYIDEATTDDIISLQYSSGDASKLFVLTQDNDAKVVVIIND